MSKEERLEEAKKLYETANSDQRYVLETLFPELKKKTDEKMIQKLIAVVHLYYGEGVDAERDECLAWLEKQSNKNINDKKVIKSIIDIVKRDEERVGKNAHLKKIQWLEEQIEPKSTERKDFISIPFGADSELIEETITIPDGYCATIEGRKVCIKKK